jgi:hypothetical protein
MVKEVKPLIEEVLWQDVRNEVARTCKTLADIIDNISPSKEYTLFKVRYPFGTKILENTLFYLPDKYKTSLPITDTKIPHDIRNKLSYSLFPLGIVVKNSIEVFRELNDKVFPIAFYGKGLDLGIWEYYNWTTPYTVTAGARSLYMLPKISEASSHKRLKKEFGVTAPPPKRMYDHWQVFTQIANSNNFSTQWYCEIIFLTGKWVESIKNNKSWLELKSYIDSKGWQHSGYTRIKSILDIAWEIFARSLNDKELRVDPYVIDTLKHLVFIGSNAIPGSAPYTGDVEAGPLKDIQIIYENPSGYGLKDYIPTIMQPKYLSQISPKPVYYSMQAPTLLQSTPRTRKVTSVIDNIREENDLLNHFLSNNNDDWSKSKIANISFCEILNNLTFEYFHSNMFAYGNLIRPTTEMPEKDPSLMYNPNNKKNRVFATNSTFLRGCVKIATKPH